MDTVDLLIVEDQEDERTTYESMARRYGLIAIAFESGLEALKYLKGLNGADLPRAYVVDMRTGNDDEELASPLEIFYFLRENNSIENFRFHTGHFSEHDREVKDLTGAQVILKAEPELEEFLLKLKSSKK